MLVVMAILFGRPDLAFAQYPGFSSDAEPASVSADADDTQSDASGNDAPANSGASSSTSSSAVAGAGSAAGSNRSGDDDSNSQTTSDGFGVATNRAKAKQSREYYFVRKLRVEFAAMELVERQTGMAFRAKMCRAISMNCALSSPRCGGQQARQCKALRMMFSILIPN